MADVFDRERRATRGHGNVVVGWVRLAPIAKAQILGGAYLATMDGKIVIMVRRYRKGDRGFREYVIYYTTVEYDGSYKTGGANKTLYDGTSLVKAKAAAGPRAASRRRTR